MNFENNKCNRIDLKSNQWRRASCLKANFIGTFKKISALNFFLRILNVFGRF